MDTRTLKALRGAIAKWHRIVYYGGIDNGSENCPLCREFPTTDCFGCPVAIKTGIDSCSNTPYQDFIQYRHTNKRQAIAKNFLKWLVLLLPEGETAKMSDGWIWYWEWL